MDSSRLITDCSVFESAAAAAAAVAANHTTPTITTAFMNRDQRTLPGEHYVDPQFGTWGYPGLSLSPVQKIYEMNTLRKQ